MTNTTTTETKNDTAGAAAALKAAKAYKPTAATRKAANAKAVDGVALGLKGARMVLDANLTYWAQALGTLKLDTEDSSTSLEILNTETVRPTGWYRATAETIATELQLAGVGTTWKSVESARAIGEVWGIEPEGWGTASTMTLQKLVSILRNDSDAKVVRGTHKGSSVRQVATTEAGVVGEEVRESAMTVDALEEQKVRREAKAAAKAEAAETLKVAKAARKTEEEEARKSDQTPAAENDEWWKALASFALLPIERQDIIVAQLVKVDRKAIKAAMKR
jgi:hypothetical protein